MSIPANAECILCHLNRHIQRARSLGDEATATAFSRALLQQLLDAPEDITSPALGPGANALYQQFYGLEQDRYKAEKAESNRFVLARMDAIRSRVAAAPESLYGALQFAILGNYIDFSALQDQVSYEKLDEMLDTAENIHVERAVFDDLCRDLEAGKKLLYLTDNAGEIGFDRIFAEELKKAYPHLQITFCVRGMPAHNDATREDAEAVGVPFPVIDNGNDVGGTELSLLSGEARQALEEADVILSKGQGNVETLYGCGYNIYFAFLVKCTRFVQVFHKPLMTPMLVRERG